MKKLVWFPMMMVMGLMLASTVWASDYDALASYGYDTSYPVSIDFADARTTASNDACASCHQSDMVNAAAQSEGTGMKHQVMVMMKISADPVLAHIVGLKQRDAKEPDETVTMRQRTSTDLRSAIAVKLDNGKAIARSTDTMRTIS